jgi:hypothetical protein
MLYSVSLLKGLLPLHELNANSFSHYYINYNSLRVGKGFIWRLLLLPILNLTVRRYPYTPYHFAYGVLLSLTVVAMNAIIERSIKLSIAVLITGMTR